MIAYHTRSKRLAIEVLEFDERHGYWSTRYGGPGLAKLSAGRTRGIVIGLYPF